MRVAKATNWTCAKSAIMIVAALAVWTYASTVDAGIMLADEVTFDMEDLERSLQANAQADNGAGGASGSSSVPERPAPQPTGDPGEPSSPFSLLKSPLPVGGTSSTGTSTSSSAGGSVGSGTCACPLATTLTLRDDSPRGRLAEDRALALPDPPGTDLLRPPRMYRVIRW